MLIDWFTVIAQIVNFLILVYLLKRFLYRPVMDAIEQREQHIAGQLEEAARKQAEAEAEQQQYKQLNEDLHHRQAGMLKEARTAAEKERQQLLDKAKQEYTDLRHSLQDALRAERARLDETLKQRTQAEVIAIARQVLRDLAETTLEAQIVKVFVQKISELPLEETPAWPEGSTGQLTVSSAFTLTDGQRATITKAVRQRWGEAVVPRFQTAPEEIGGIELAAGGYKLAWTIAEYLSGLEKRVAELAEALPETKATPTKKEHVN